MFDLMGRKGNEERQWDGREEGGLLSSEPAGTRDWLTRDFPALSSDGWPARIFEGGIGNATVSRVELEQTRICRCGLLE